MKLCNKVLIIILGKQIKVHENVLINIFITMNVYKDQIDCKHTIVIFMFVFITILLKWFWT